ncbi:MAG: restriction endonuclease subunit S [Marinomonas sp.]|uniref:restriction endonuclease subunit S n=1 Tax=Marinomonas sp. TaxID=1904862 RepID=UPI003F9ACC2D
MIGLSFIEKLLDGASVAHLPLEKIAKIKHGKDWKKLASGDIPVYGSGGIMGYVDTYSYDKPTVLIPRKGTITNLFYVDSVFWNVDTIYYTEIDETKILPKYLYYTKPNN